MTTADRPTAELCRILLKTFFGDILAQVANALLICGRSELATISRKTDLSSRFVKQALATLIQHNFVRWVTIDEYDRERTFYEADWSEVLNILHYGREIRWVAEELSAEAAAIVKYILLHGRVKAADLVSVFTGENEQTGSAVDQILYDLLERRFLKTASLNEIRPDEDLKRQFYNEESKKHGGKVISEAKEKKVLDEAVRRRLDDFKESKYSDTTGLKRKSEFEINRTTKRTKTEASVEGDAIVRVNHEQFLVYQRNQDLINLCRARFGATPAAVYKYILKLIQRRVSHPQHLGDLKFTTLQLIAIIPSDLDLDSIWVKPESNGKRKETRDVDSDEDFIEHDDHEMADDEDYNPDKPDHDIHRTTSLIRFLQLFAGDSLSLLRKCSSNSLGEWSINYTHLSAVLQNLEIEYFVQQKFGDVAPRLLRIIKTKRKIDEKQLSSIALLRAKDIRHVLTALHESNILDLQEVPKRLDRQPSMTYYLWCHNEERARQSIVADIMSSIARLYTRLSSELGRNGRLLEKAARTDVRNREQEFLTKDELGQLRRIRVIEEKMLAQSARLSNSFTILSRY